VNRTAGAPAPDPATLAASRTFACAAPPLHGGGPRSPGWNPLRDVAVIGRVLRDVVGVASPTMARRRAWLAALPFLVMLGLVLWDPEAAILGLLSDDAFYYVKIARSIVSGGGSSFDGIAATNGYHPLWMLCMVAVCKLTGEALLAPVIVAILISGAVCGLALWVLYDAVERWAAPGFGALAVSLCLLPNLLTAMTNGMETGILLLAVFAWVWGVHRHDWMSCARPLRAQFSCGLVLGLIFLCRLDSAFLVIATGALFLAAGILTRVPWRDLIVRCLAMVAGVLVLAVPYFAWSQIQFGSLSPISGRVKSSFPALRANLDLDGDVKYGLALVVLDVLLALSVATIDRRRGRQLASVLVSPLTVLTVGALMHFAYTFLFMTWGVYWWHFVVYGAAFALGVAQLAQRASTIRPDARPALRTGLPILIGVVGIATQTSAVASKVEAHREWLLAAEWARDHTDEHAIFAMKDAGLFGWFSRRQVINLDGKANGYRFLESLERGDVLAYLEQHGVSYVADINGFYLDGRALVELPRVRPPWLALWMALEDEVYRGKTYSRRRLAAEDVYAAHFAIWKFDPRPRR